MYSIEVMTRATQPIRTILNRFGKSPNAKIPTLKLEHHKLRLPSQSQFFSNSSSINKEETAYPLVPKDFREQRAHHLTEVEIQMLARKWQLNMFPACERQIFKVSSLLGSLCSHELHR